MTKARLIGNVEANVIAAERGVEIQYDERYQSPFFYYEIGGRRYEVWFEDVRSIYAKLSWLQKRISMVSGIELDASVSGKLVAGESDASLHDKRMNE